MQFQSFKEMRYMFFESEMRSRYRTIFLIRTFGNVLILSSIMFVLSQFYPVIAAEFGYRWDQTVNPEEKQQAQLPEEIRVPEPYESGQPLPTVRPLPPLAEPPINTEFGLVIPKIKANARVVADVDPFSPSQYDLALKKGVAHARGTNYPGEVGNVYMFAHNTLNAWDIPKYNAIFFLLHNLEVGDRITTFYKQERFDYIVFDKKVFSPKDLSPIDTKYSEPVLSLQTCWPPGTTWQRLVVRAKIDQ
jgi:LPXTG-site transpeptidase (sortase) family protein